MLPTTKIKRAKRTIKLLRMRNLVSVTHNTYSSINSRSGDLSQEQIQQLRVLFKSFDTDAKGYLIRGQIERLLETLKREWSKQSPSHGEIFDTLQSQLLSAATPVDGDIHLTSDDFLNTMALISEVKKQKFNQQPAYIWNQALHYQTLPEKPKEQVFEANSASATPPVVRRYRQEVLHRYCYVFVNTKKINVQQDKLRQQQHQLELQELKHANNTLRAVRIITLRSIVTLTVLVSPFLTPLAK